MSICCAGLERGSYKLKRREGKEIYLPVKGKEGGEGGHQFYPLKIQESEENEGKERGPSLFA